jgi:primosomal protein N' (replication factor Y)
MEPRIAEVAIPRHVDRNFDYRLPENLAGSAAIGMRARVRFRDETLEGFIVDLKAESNFSGRLLEIQELLDERPLWGERELELARWISEYYLCPLGLVLESFAPASALQGSAGRPVSYAKLATDLTQALRATEELKQNAPQQAAVLEALLSLGTAPTLAALRARVGCSDGPFRALAQRGLLTIERRIAPPARPETGYHELTPVPELSAEQAAALESIERALALGDGRFLLHGVNASGKTEVYIRAVQRALALGRGAIIVVPEISLTPQLITRFRARLGDEVALYHSGLTPAQRAVEWARLRSGEARVAIGVRAAIFAPVKNLGLIVVDEEHEPTYKQDDPAPRYHAREVALKRAELEGAVVVLGSATPSVETYFQVRRGGLKLLRLKERVGGGPPSQIQIVDVADEKGLLSPPLAQAIAAQLKRQEQAILLLNRRGFSRAVYCKHCRETQKCPRCGVALIYHYREQQLRCHYCGHRASVGGCRRCGSTDLIHVGVGTEQAELAIHRAFSRVRVRRMDSDAVRRGEHGPILEAFRKGEIDILLGTQIVGLGLDFPNVTLVGVLSADTLLDLPDFRAGERTFQLISQAGGRAGRGVRQSEVIVQTRHPEHYAIQQVVIGDYRGFYEEELVFRRSLGYPPFTHLIKLTVEERQEERAKEQIQALAAALQSRTPQTDLAFLGPYPSVPYRLKGMYRWQLIIKTKDVLSANAIIRTALGDLKLFGRVKADVDPQGLMG